MNLTPREASILVAYTAALIFLIAVTAVLNAAERDCPRDPHHDDRRVCQQESP